MTVEEEVNAAPSPKDGLLAVARALDVLLAREPARPDDDWATASWGTGFHGGEADMVEQLASEAHADEAVNIPPPNEAKREARFEFAEITLRLPDALPAVEAVDAYVKGGPRWLYAYDRELVLSYPDHVKRAMLEDVDEDDPKAAAEMAADLLKVPTQGVMSGVQVGG